MKIYDLQMDGVQISEDVSFTWKMYQELDKSKYDKPSTILSK